MNSTDLSLTIVVSILIIAVAAVKISENIGLTKIGEEALKQKQKGEKHE